ncbi:hypothetical protein VTJ83DRAFT_3758 [Remersonia thermophila]|uniref:Uncharacterized protein n=1 Tax=Remersonia thermophila TaxID=72144 RepID=A0ABR4DEZ6_9PEZI
MLSTSKHRTFHAIGPSQCHVNIVPDTTARSLSPPTLWGGRRLELCARNRNGQTHSETLRPSRAREIDVFPAGFIFRSVPAPRPH